MFNLVNSKYNNNYFTFFKYVYKYIVNIFFKNKKKIN